MSSDRRRRNVAFVLGCVVTLAGVIFLAVKAQAANIFELNFWLSGPRYDAVVPLCEEPGALGQIQAHFAEKEGQYWNSDLHIVGFERVHELSFRPWVEGTIPRRFCSATALVSDGVKRPVHYSIGENTGWLGVGYGVEWCVVGLDRNWAYNPACRMAKP
jgi:hypothetical protein